MDLGKYMKLKRGGGGQKYESQLIYTSGKIKNTGAF